MQANKYKQCKQRMPQMFIADKLKLEMWHTDDTD